MKETNKVKEELLWREYKTNNCKKSKEELILHYIPLVKYVVGRVIKKVPNKFSFDDLLNYGFIGLIDAIERFKLDKNIKFATYAVSRIRGNVYDEIRKLDWVPQSIRRKSKEFNKNYLELEQELGRTPSDEEMSCKLGLSKEEFYELVSQVNIHQNISLESIFVPRDGKQIELKTLIKDDSDQEPDNLFFYAQMKEILGKAIDRLPEKERLVVSLYYYEGLTLTQIGEVMALTTSRISQMHTKAIFRLRGYLSRKKEMLV